MSPEGLERWAVLEKFATLTNEDAMCQIRNCMAFHLGDEDVVARGIQRLSKAAKSLIVTAANSTRIEARHDIASDVLLSGLNIRPVGVAKGTPNGRRPMKLEEPRDTVAEAAAAHMAMLHLFDDLLIDLLRHAGASYEPLPPYVPFQDEAQGNAP